MNSPPADAIELKLCPTCGLDRPLTAFRLRRKGGDARHSQCNACRRLADARKSAMRRESDLGKFVSRINRADTSRQVELAGQAMIRRFGGARQFTALWHREIMAVSARRPGSRLALQSHYAIARLIEVGDASQQPATPPVSQMTDAELEAELRELVHAEAMSILEEAGLLDGAGGEQAG